MHYCDVALSIASIEVLTYSVPRDMEGQVEIGKRVLVPLGRRRVTGYVVGMAASSDREGIRDVIEVLDHVPLFRADDLAFYRWVADYYLYPLGMALKSILPGGIDVSSDLWLTLTPQGEETAAADLSDRAGRIVTLLREYPEGCSIRKVREGNTGRYLQSDITKLQEQGILQVEHRIGKAAVSVKRETVLSVTAAPPPDMKLTEKQRRVFDLIDREGDAPLSLLREKVSGVHPVVRSLAKKGLIGRGERECYRRPPGEDNLGCRQGEVTLTAEQQGALDTIRASIASATYAPHLLHGVTGSGKTEIYLRAMDEVLGAGGSVLYLVPEISLTPQLVSRITGRFDKDMIAILHSGISRVSRYDEWRRIQKGEARIIAGARSAVFSPVKDLRLIIVDEEHDGSYKQDDHMTYHARDIAIMRASMVGATVLLGSATPSVRTYFNTKERGFGYIELTKRVEERPMPAVEIIDMKEERGGRGGVPILSRPLKDAIGQTLAAGKQTLLFLNRRGFNTFLCCADCGHVLTCANCSIALTHHAGEGALRCHYCDYRIKSPPICPACGGSNVRSYGVGTERLEDEITALFPQARVQRMDSDSTSQRGAHGKILRSFDRGETDILIGTQMITKGHDYPNVTLVGVVSADSSLNIPDFRASERTFQIITQVAGRSGRGDMPGRVIVQTFNPGNYAIALACQYDYHGFYEAEVTNRRQLGYPPFSRMVNLRISSPREEKAEQCARRLGEIARGESARYGIDVMGPAESPLAKIKGRYRWHLLLKGGQSGTVRSFARALLETTRRSDPDIRVDVDPVNFM